MRHAACLPARMGGGGKTGIDAQARASGHRPPHGGVYFRFREREGKALGVPAQTETEAISRPSPQRGKDRHPCGRRDADGRCGGKRSGDKAVVPKGAAPPVPRESAPVARLARIEARVPCGSAKQHRALGSAKRGKERDLNFSRSAPTAPDRHPNGPGPQARSASADRAGCPTG